jgi:hypothetical protein
MKKEKENKFYSVRQLIALLEDYSKLSNHIWASDVERLLRRCEPIRQIMSFEVPPE